MTAGFGFFDVEIEADDFVRDHPWDGAHSSHILCRSQQVQSFETKRILQEAAKKTIWSLPES